MTMSRSVFAPTVVRYLNRLICHLTEHAPCDMTEPLYCERCWSRLYPRDRFDVFGAE